MLTDFLNRVKEWLSPRENEITLVFIIVLTALISFGLGRLSAINDKKFPISVAQEKISQQNNEGGDKPEVKISTETLSANSFVASKNSSVYHYSWCPGAKQIKEENKIYFTSKEEAEKAGFRPASNCQGL